jgi:hypothetical protein
MPPNGLVLLRSCFEILASLSNRSPSTIDTEEASGTNVCAGRQRLTFIDNQNFGAKPSSERLLVLSDFGGEVFCRFNSEADTSEGVNGDTADVASSDT